MKAANHGRYFAYQFYIGCFEVMDTESSLFVVQCRCHFDAFSNIKEAVDDARIRAETIAHALNLIEFDWKAPDHG